MISKHRLDDISQLQICYFIIGKKLMKSTNTK